MKCPHCGESISLFSREINRFTKEKSCPHCNSPIRMALNFKVAAVLFIPAIIMALLLKPLFVSFGFNGNLATGLATGLLVMLAMRLKAA